MQAVVHHKGSQGLPTLASSTDLSNRRPEITFSRGAMWDSLNATVGWLGGVDEGLEIANRWLGSMVTLFSPDGDWCWEGICWTVRFGAGTRMRSRSLEGYANRVRVHYVVQTDALVTDGPGVPVVANDTAGQERYGVIEYQHSAGSVTAAAAASIAAEQLARRSRLLALPESGSAGAAASIELQCVGVHRALGYTAYTSDTAGTAAISEVIKDMLATVPFVSTDLSQIETTTEPTVQAFDLYETPQDIIKRLMNELPGYVFGIGRNRVAYLRPSHRMDTRASYVEHVTGVIETSNGARIPPYLVKPDTVLRQLDFVPTSGVTTTAIDSIENVYLASTRYSSRDNSCSYESVIPGVLGEVTL